MTPSAASPGTASPRFTAVAIVLHWTIGLGILAMLAMGLAMTHAPLPASQKFALYQLHKSVGITILLAAALRLLWRLTHRPPALPRGMPRWEKAAAGGTHLLLYALMIGMPLVGWLLVSASPLSLPTVLYGRVVWPHVPITAWFGWSKPRASVALSSLHAAGGYALIVLVLVHAGAALRHHLVLRDGVLRRMIPGLPWLGRPAPEPRP
jgi:cytochrome b561